MKKILLVLSLSLLIVGAHQLYAWTEPAQGPLLTNVTAPLRYPLNSFIWGLSNLSNDQGGNIELGGTNGVANSITGGAPYMDFHFGTGAAQDYNARIINNGNNMLSFSTAAANPVMTINGANLGIGTQAPSYKLHVVGDVNVTGCYRVNGVCLAPGGSGTVTGSGTGGYVPLWTGSGASTALGNSSMFETGGDIGIGNAVPNYKLDVTGDVNITGNYVGNGKVAIQSNDSWLRFNPTNNFASGIYAGTGIFRTDGRFEVGSGGTSFVVAAGGNVGIGASAPADKLEINGSLRFSIANPAINASSYLVIPGGAYFNSSTVYMEAPLQARGGIHNDTGANLVISGGTSGATVFNSGNVGIGTASPDNPLQVSGWIHSSNIYADNGSGGSIVGATGATEFFNRTTGIFAGLYGITNASSGYGVYAQNLMGGSLTAYALYCTSPTTGVACGGNHGWNQTSDARLKKDITPISNALAKIIKLQGVDFYWKRDTNNEKQNLGFIAQQVLPILPEAVGKDAEGYYSMDYGAVAPVLVEAVKELNTKVDKLQSENDDLRVRLEKLEAKVGK